MRSVRLLEYALTKEPENVLDVGVGQGQQLIPFLGQGCRVMGIDVRGAPLEHPLYTHAQGPYEHAKLEVRGEYDEETQTHKLVPAEFDLVWSSHVIEHVPNVQHFLVQLRKWCKPGGWLMIAAPNSSQDRLHIGHLSLWTPAHLIYNLVCAGWNCKEALWHTDYLTIGVAVQKTDDIDMSWRTAMPNELYHLSQFMPIPVRHEDGAWWANNWPEEFETERAIDPPSVTIGLEKSNLPPVSRLAFGPNPKLRKPSGKQSFNNQTGHK